jgi:hypothetical protein
MARELNEALGVVSLIASCVHLETPSCAAPGMPISISVDLFGRTLHDCHLNHFLVDRLTIVMMCQVPANLHRECSNHETCLVVEFRLCRLNQGNVPMAPRPWPGLSSQSSISHLVHTFRTPSMLFGIACGSRSKLDERLNFGGSTAICIIRSRW